MNLKGSEKEIAIRVNTFFSERCRNVNNQLVLKVWDKSNYTTGEKKCVRIYT